MMRAWVVDRPGSIDDHPLRLVERPIPEPDSGQVRLRVQTCGVCRTDLHLAEGDLRPKHPGVIPGHEAVGLVERLGPGAKRFSVGQRIGVPWLAQTCGTCRFCVTDRENLCLEPQFTGWDVDGGYAGIVDDYDGVFQRLDLEPGAHEIEIRTAGRPLVYDVNVTPGQTVTIHANVR